MVVETVCVLVAVATTKSRAQARSDTPVQALVVSSQRPTPPSAAAGARAPRDAAAFPLRGLRGRSLKNDLSLRFFVVPRIRPTEIFRGRSKRAELLYRELNFG